ncbi:MAG TPA: glycosyltransferase [Acidothermaceae bacterium]
MSSIGVIMAAYNAERWIADSLASLQAQSVQAWCCVVVDDGSTDATASIVAGIAAADPRILLVKQIHSGVAATRNVGLHHLDGNVDVISLLDSDDVLVPDAFAVLTTALEARPDAVGVFGLAEYIDAEGKQFDAGRHPASQQDRRRIRGIRLVSVDVGDDSTFADMIVYGPIWPSAVGLHRRAALQAVGGFDPALRVISDWDAYVRMSRRGPFVMVDRQVAWYRRHDANVTNDSSATTAGRAKVLRKTWLDQENTAAQRRLIVRGLWLSRAADTPMLTRTLLGALRRGDGEHAVRASVALSRHLARLCCLPGRVSEQRLAMLLEPSPCTTPTRTRT